MCDHKCRFLHCYAGNVGSVHDQRVFRLSEVADYIESDDKFPRNSHLVGDSAYVLHEHLLVPYRDNGHLTRRQKNYNFCHSSTRIAIERAFGLLKGRFRSLLTVLDMERVDLIPDFILACCALHNICLLNKDELGQEGHEVVVEVNDAPEHPLAQRVDNVARRKRDEICESLQMQQPE